MNDVSVELVIKCSELVNDVGYIVLEFFTTEFITEVYPEGEKIKCNEFGFNYTEYSNLEQSFIKDWIINNYEYICDKLTVEYYNQYSPLLTKLS